MYSRTVAPASFAYVEVRVCTLRSRPVRGSARRVAREDAARETTYRPGSGTVSVFRGAKGFAPKGRPVRESTNAEG